MSHDSKEVRQRLAQLHNNFVSKDLSEGIRSQVFFATFVQKVETQIKSAVSYMANAIYEFTV